MCKVVVWSRVHCSFQLVLASFIVLINLLLNLCGLLCLQLLGHSPFRKVDMDMVDTEVSTHTVSVIIESLIHLNFVF